MSTTVIHLEPTKAKQRAQIVNDALPGIILLFTGLGTFLDYGFTQRIMPYIDVVVGIIVIRTALAELRRNKEPRTINWFDVSAGCVILIEAGTMYKSYKGFQPAHLLFLVGIITVVRGLFAAKVPHMRRVVLSDHGIVARTSLLRTLTCPWSGLLRIRLLPSSVQFVHEDRIRALNLRRVENRAEIIRKIVEAAKERGIPADEGEEPPVSVEPK